VTPEWRTSRIGEIGGSFLLVCRRVVIHWRAIILLLILALATFLIAHADLSNCLGPWPALDFAKLDACRPEPASNQEKQSLLASLPERGEVKNLPEGQKRRLSALNAVLAVGARD